MLIRGCTDSSLLGFGLSAEKHQLRWDLIRSPWPVFLSAYPSAGQLENPQNISLLIPIKEEI